MPGGSQEGPTQPAEPAGGTAGARSCSPSLFVLLRLEVEKAVAIHCGGWDEIDGGQCTHAWRLLTGCSSEHKHRWDRWRKADGTWYSAAFLLDDRVLFLWVGLVVTVCTGYPRLQPCLDHPMVHIKVFKAIFDTHSCSSSVVCLFQSTRALSFEGWWWCLSFS